MIILVADKNCEWPHASFVIGQKIFEWVFTIGFNNSNGYPECNPGIKLVILGLFLGILVYILVILPKVILEKSYITHSSSTESLLLSQYFSSREQKKKLSRTQASATNLGPSLFLVIRIKYIVLE